MNKEIENKWFTNIQINRFRAISNRTKLVIRRVVPAGNQVIGDLSVNSRIIKLGRIQEKWNKNQMLIIMKKRGVIHLPVSNQ